MLFVVLLAAAACALVVGWGLNLLGFVPFPVLGNVVLLNNFVAAGVLAPLVLRVLHPRVKTGGLALHGSRRRADATRGHRSRFVLAAAAAFTFGGHVAGNLIYAGYWTPPWVRAFGISSPSRAFEIGVGLLPFVVGAFAVLPLPVSEEALALRGRRRRVSRRRAREALARRLASRRARRDGRRPRAQRRRQVDASQVLEPHRPDSRSPPRFAAVLRVLGRRADELHVRDLADLVGFVFQDFEAQLFSTSVEEEVVFGLEQLGVDPRSDAPAGSTARSPRSVSRASSGAIRRRCRAARSSGSRSPAVLALEPELWLLDEPSTDLDPAGRRELFALLARLRAARTDARWSSSTTSRR